MALPGRLARIASAITLAAFAMLTPAASPAAADPVRGAGSTFVAPLMDVWQQRFRVVQTDGADQLSVDLGVDYEPVGSLAGVLRATQLGMDFGATDRPLSSDELTKLGLAQFPIVMGGIAIVVNLPGIEAGLLQLDGPVLADILRGKITRWDDPSIVALNPTISLPASAIVSIHRADGSGTTFNLADFLARKSDAWRTEVGVDTVLNWPTGRAVKGNEGLAQAVKATPFAIGYVEAGYVARLGLADVRIKNAAGAFVRVGPAALSEAAASADWASTKDFFLLLNDASGAGAYPIVATVFVVTPREDRTGRRRAMLQFFRLALESWGEDASDRGYVPLPPALVGQVKSYWKTTLGAVGG